MEKDALFSNASKKLDNSRTLYIDAQIVVESGWNGLLRKLGYGKPSSREPGEYQLRESQRIYYSALDEYRELVINEFKKNTKKIIQNDIETIAKLTVFDEINRLREEKERRLRRQGLKGLLRLQLQEWRELTPGYKMLMGMVFSLSAILLGFVSFVNLNWLRIAVLASGIIVFLEGLQQKLTRRNAVSKGMNRASVYASAKKRLPKTTRGLTQNLHQFHARLEKEIWNLRVYEKRVELRRYLVAGIGGALVGSIYLLPYGVKSFLMASATALISRVLWFVLPYGAVNSAMSFKGGVLEAQAAELGAGEGSDNIGELGSIVSRASASDPVLMKAQEAGTANPFLGGEAGGLAMGAMTGSAAANFSRSASPPPEGGS